MNAFRFALERLATRLRRTRFEHHARDGASGESDGLETNAITLSEELTRVLDDPLLAHSPVQVRLLKYLVDMALSGRGKTLKSYSVAVDGLGRNPDFDAQVDTYARVQVGRLRTVLDSFYAGAGSHHIHRLKIDKGSYEVRLVANGDVQSAGSPPKWFLPNWSLATAATMAGLVVISVLAGVLTSQWQSQSRAAGDRWRTSDFPFVDVVVTSDSGKNQDKSDLIRELAISDLQKYEGIRVNFGTNIKADYTVSIDFDSSCPEHCIKAFIIYNKIDRVIYSGKLNIVHNDAATYGQAIGNLAFITSHPTGVIHSNERKFRSGSETPYGCWLAFTAKVQSDNTRGDEPLRDCASAWYAAAPSHPLAAGLRAWTMIDDSISQISDSRRQEVIQEAIEILESAKGLNPRSPFLSVAAMRAYAFSGDREALRAAATQALELNPDNLDVQGMTGLMLSLWNDPQGEALLNQAIAQHFNPPPWYFVGKFVAAMMRNDTEGAQQALKRIEMLHHSLPIPAILSAAVEAHAGHLVSARASWERAKAMQPILRISPDTLIGRLPIAPEVRSRLKEWLAPVLA